MIAGLVGWIGYGFIPPRIAVDFVRPVRGSLEITVDDDGETRIREKYVVSAPVTGKMLRIQLEAGDFVRQGETELAQIKPVDPALLDIRTRAETQARVRASQAAMQQADAATARAKEALRLASEELKRATTLKEKNAISESDFDTAVSRERIADAELRSAEFAARVAAYELDQAEAVLRYTLPGEGDRFDETTFRIISPVDGRVLNILHEDSTVVSAAMPLMELGDPRDMEIKIDVLSIDAVRIRPGNRVWIEHWGGGRPLRGTVRLVEPSAFLKISALGVEEKRVNVIIDFDDPWETRESLGDGFRVEARIVVAETEASSLKVPSGTLFSEDDRWFVFVVRGGRAMRTPVTVGKSNGVESEILDGIVETDVLIEHPPDSILDGSKVAAI
jgi:HlyD family secretion protein